MGAGNVIQNAMDKLFLDKLSQNNVDNAKQNALILREIKEQHDDELMYHYVDNEFYAELIEKIDEISDERKLAQVASGKQLAVIENILEDDNHNSLESAKENSALLSTLSQNAVSTEVIDTEKIQANALVSIKDDIHKSLAIQEKEQSLIKADKVKSLTQAKTNTKAPVASTKTKKGKFDMKMFMGGLGKILKTLFNPIALVTAFIMEILPWVLIFGALFVGMWSKLSTKVKAKLVAIGLAIVSVIAFIKLGSSNIMNFIFKGASLLFKTKSIFNATEHSTGMLTYIKKMIMDVISFIKDMAIKAFQWLASIIQHALEIAKVAFQIALSISVYILIAVAVVAIVLIFACLLLIMVKLIGWIVKEIIGTIKEIFQAIIDIFGPYVKTLMEIIVMIAIGVAMMAFWPYIIVGLLGATLFKLISMVLDAIVTVLQSIADSIAKLLVHIVEAMEPLFATVGAILKTVLTVLTVLIPVFDFLTEVIKLIVKLVGVIFEVLIVPFKVVFKLLGNLLKHLIPVFENLYSILTPVINLVGSLLEAVGTLLGAIGEIVGEILEPLMEVFMPLVSVIRAVLKFILLPLKIVVRIFSAIMKVIGKIFDLFANLVDAVFMPIAAVIDFVVGLIDSVVKVIGGVLAVLMSPFKWLLSLFGFGASASEPEKKKKEKETGPDNALYTMMETEKLNVLEEGFESIVNAIGKLMAVLGFTAVVSLFTPKKAANADNDNEWKDFMKSVKQNVEDIRDVIVGEDSAAFVSNMFATNETKNKNTTSYATLTTTDSVVQSETVQPDVNVNVAGNDNNMSTNVFNRILDVLNKIEANTKNGSTNILGV